jgi:hypothetical protein
MPLDKLSDAELQSLLAKLDVLTTGNATADFVLFVLSVLVFAVLAWPESKPWRVRLKVWLDEARKRL